MYTKKQQLHKPRGRLRSKRSLATGIPKHVRQEVLVRDNGSCVICGSMQWLECHHVIERSLGGMGIKENLVMLCKHHHQALHNGDNNIKVMVKKYLDKLYDMSDQDKKYNKWR